MAVNNSRRMVADLAEGMSDGMYKKVVTDRGGAPEGATLLARSTLDDLYFGIHETKQKVLGDGTIHTTPDFQATPAPSMQRW
jgi:hypothetical protein